jgi:ribonuclease HI
MVLWTGHKGCSGNLDNTHAIHFFTDNTGTIQRIFKGTPGKAQSHSRHFRQNILEILDRHPNISITVEWVPSHCKIQGNEIADCLAKRGSRLQPPDPNWSSYTYVGTA